MKTYVLIATIVDNIIRLVLSDNIFEDEEDIDQDEEFADDEE